MTDRPVRPSDPLLLKYQPSELRIASEFLTNWLPFLSTDLCSHCSQTLSDRVRSLGHELDTHAEPELSNENSDLAAGLDAHAEPERPIENSDPSNLDKLKLQQEVNDDHDENCDTNSIHPWKDGWSEPVAREQSTSRSPSHHRMSWADIAQEEEDELGGEEEGEEDSETMAKRMVDVNPATGDLRVSMTAVQKRNTKLSREQREYIRFMKVKRKKDFICLERFRGKLVNILEGLELHTGIFSKAEQEKIVNFVYKSQEMGRKGELKG